MSIGKRMVNTLIKEAEKEQEENENMNNKNIFTKDEKTILKSLPKNYKWIARDECGAIYVYASKPQRQEFVFKCQDGYASNISIFKHIFKGVTWVSSPICFRPPILDKVERRYLKNVFEPFHNRIKYVEKVSPYALKEKCYIWACVGEDDSLELPIFDKINMYKGMELAKQYTLEELGIKYD